MVDYKQLAAKYLESKTYKAKGLRPLVRVVAQNSKGLQNVHTPYDLCDEIVGKLGEHCDLEYKSICVLFNLEFLDVLIKDYGVSPSQITFIADSLLKEKVAKEWYKIGETHQVTYALKEIEIMPKIKKQFDVVVQNPPYQANKESKAESQHSIKAGAAILWDKFVDLGIKLTKQDGFAAFVHPAGWRRPNSTARAIGTKIRSRRVLYLEMHSIQDGLRAFNASTNFDWYILQNVENDGETVVRDFSGQCQKVCIADLPFIPNSNLSDVLSLVARNGDQPCTVIWDSVYHTQKTDKMSEIETSEFKHPCIYSLPQKGMRLWYSNDQDGHFGVPKVIFTNGAATQVIVDRKGEYGLTQFAYGIVDAEENLDSIKQALESQKFVSLCEAFRFTFNKYDDAVIRLFRKDFWKEFV